ncbi:MAG: MFS transporter [archaeon]
MVNNIKRGEIGFLKELKQLPRSIKLSTFLAFVYVIGWGVTNPFLPLFIQEKLGSYTNFGIIMFLFYIFAFLLDFPMGVFLEKVRPKKIMIVGFLLMMLIPLILLNSTLMWHFILFSLFHAIASITIWIAFESYVRKHSPKNKEALAFGMYDAGIIAAFILGALASGLLIYKIGFNIFYAITITSFIAIFVLNFLPDKKKGASLQSGLRNTLRLTAYRNEFRTFYKNKELMKMYVNIFLYRFSYGFLVLMIPLFFREIHAGYFLIGLIYALLFLPAIFEPYYGLIKNKKRAVNLALIIIVFLFVAMFLIKSVYILFLLTVLVAIPFSLIYPIFQGRITQLMPKKKITEMNSILYSTSHLALGLGPLTAGILADLWGINIIFLMGAVMFLILSLYNLGIEY